MSNELDELMTDDFLSGLDSPSNNNEGLFDKPPWVRGDTGHTTFKAWRAILDLQAIKEKSIKNYGKVADRKTPKSLYQIKKSEVADIVESPRVHRRPVCLSQATLPDSFKLS